MDVAFAPNGDVYIGEGHADESPNDIGSDDPANKCKLCVTASLTCVKHLASSTKHIRALTRIAYVKQ